MRAPSAEAGGHAGGSAAHDRALPASRRPTKAVLQLQHDLASIFGAAIMAHAQWAVEVRSLDTGELLYQLNSGKLMVPASNMKIVTLAGAAQVLGWDHRFTTTLETTAPIESGVLQGDLVVRGGGDPSINTRDRRGAAVFAAWASALKTAGIAEINGRVVGDDQFFDDEGIGAGWAWDYLQYAYAAPVGALQYNEDVADLTIGPGARAGEPALVSLSPGAGLTLWNRAVTGALSAVENIDYRRHLHQPVLEITGTIPAGAQPLLRQVAVVNPTVFFAQSLKDALVSRGIAVTGDAVDFDDVAATMMTAAGAERRVLARTESPPLREIAGVLMQLSQNLYAETVLKAAGAARGGLGTAEAGRSAVLAVFNGWNISTQGLVMVDASGLSRYNYVTADLIISILERMHRDPEHREAFTAALPTAGRDGTVSTRMRRTRAEGNAIAKTGSISNVRALSGYVRTRDGERLVFSVLANHFIVPAATVNWIADLAVEVLANFTRRP